MTDDDTKTAYDRGRSDGWRAAVTNIMESVRLFSAEVCDEAEQAALCALVAKACAVKMHDLGRRWEHYYDLSPLSVGEKAQLDRAIQARFVPLLDLTDEGAWLLRRETANRDPQDLAAARQKALERLRQRKQEGQP
jgi:hypothetical protein